MHTYRNGIMLLLVLTIGSIDPLRMGLVNNASSRQTEEGRIPPSDLTLSNVEDFQRQVRRDLPLGTEKADVEAYLTRWNINHHFVGPDHFYELHRNTFQATIENIGKLYPFPASLSIRIHLDAS